MATNKRFITKNGLDNNGNTIINVSTPSAGTDAANKSYVDGNPGGWTTNTGTVTSVSGTGTVSGLTLTGSVTTSGSLTLGGAITGFATSSHNHTLDGLSNTTITSNTAGEILKWNGSAWINNTLAEAGIQPAGSYLTGTKVDSFNTRTGAVTLTSGDVTTALGFTPATSSHNHTYNVNDAWLRYNGDSGTVRLYGNTRQMVFRTDGTTEYATGIGPYPYAWMYAGDAVGQRLMLLSTAGDLWTSNNGWLSTALSSKYSASNPPPYPAEADTLATVTARGASTSTAVTLSYPIGDGTAALRLSPSSSSGSFQWATTSLSSGLGSGQTMIHLLGNATGTNNSGYVGYQYGGAAGSANSFVSLGLYGNDNILRIYGGTYTQSLGSMRAPIFYDSDDTSYYVDPHSNSRTNKLGVGGSSLDSSTVLSVSGTSHFPNDIYTGGTPGTLNSWGARWWTSSGQMYWGSNGANFTNYGYGTQITTLNIASSGAVTAYESFRAPIFYDSNSTSYYVDPAGASVLNDIRAASGNTQIVYGNTGANTKWKSLDSGTTAVGISLYNYQDTWTMQLYAAPGAYGFLNGNWASWDLRKIPSGNLHMNNNDSYYLNAPGDNFLYRVYGAADIRSPIFYDYNDTGYYVDPNSTSNVLTLVANNYILANGHIYTNGAGQHFRARYTGGSDVYSGLFNWYGLQLGNNGDNYIVAGKTAGGGRLNVYVNNTSEFPTINGTHSSRFDSDGIFYNYHSVRAPIFYDYNDTSYYVNPNGTTNTNVMYAYSYQGNGNVGSTGAASWHPSGIYCGSTNWMYGTTYKNNTWTYDQGGIVISQSSSTRNNGIIGTYDPTMIAAIWSMGSSYQIGSDGTPGGLYGMCYSYEPNYGGAGRNSGAISGLGHQMQWRSNGATQTAIGTGIYTVGEVTAYSDRRIKTNLKVIDNALEKIGKINGYTFDRVDKDVDPVTGELQDKPRQAGVVAQEVQEVLPEVVRSAAETGHLSVAYDRMVALLIEGIKELTEQNKTLAARITELENKQ